MEINIPIELCRENAVLPVYAHDTDGAMDVYATISGDIYPGQTALVPLGIKVAIPSGYAILIQPRSGMSLKTNLRVANTPGLIDAGYRDEIGVIMTNISNDSVEHIHEGDRIAQMRLVEIPKIKWDVVSDVKTIFGDRGGGFGSTGK